MKHPDFSFSVLPVDYRSVRLLLLLLFSAYYAHRVLTPVSQMLSFVGQSTLSRDLVHSGGFSAEPTCSAGNTHVSVAALQSLSSFSQL